MNALEKTRAVSPLAARLLAHLPESGEARTARRLAHEAGLSEHDVLRAVAELLHRGLAVELDSPTLRRGSPRLGTAIRSPTLTHTNGRISQ